MLANDVYRATDLPQIQLIIRHADQNLHWALWNLGQMDEIRPDLPGSIIEPKRRAAKPARKKRK
ncbi:hypothetical protein D3C83_209210 [compost metagenome]